MKLDIGYVDSWQIRDKKDVHPSHCTAIVEVEALRELLEKTQEEFYNDIAFDKKEMEAINMFVEQLFAKTEGKKMNELVIREMDDTIAGEYRFGKEFTRGYRCARKELLAELEMGVSPPITPKKESFDTNFSKKFVEE